MRSSSSRFPSTATTLGSGTGVGEARGDASAVADGEGDGVCATSISALMTRQNNVAVKISTLGLVLVLGFRLREFGRKVRAAYPNRPCMSITFLVESKRLEETAKNVAI